MSDYIIMASGGLAGDEFLAKLWAVHFIVKLFQFEEQSNAGLEDTTGEGRVPDFEDLWLFSERQPAYAKELRIRQALLTKMTRKRKLR